MIKDKNILHKILQGFRPTVYLPNKESITSTESGHLPIPHISPTSTKAHILPGLKSASLISLGQLCNNDCIIHLTKKTLHVFKHKKLILTGYRNLNDGLWDVPLPQPSPLPSSPTPPHQINNNQTPKPSSQANVIINKSTTKQDLAKYFHACCFSPCPSTFIKAIKKGHFITWPGLTDALIY